MQVWILLRHLDQKMSAKVGFHNFFKEPKQSRSRIKLSANLERLEASTRGERGPGLWCVVCEVGMCGNLDAGLQGDGNC